MADYKDMYFKLLDQMTRAANILQWAQLEGAEAYIDCDDPSIIQLFKNEGGRVDEAMNICTLYVSRAGKGGFSSPVIVFSPSWLQDMGFIPGALVQVLPEAGGLFFILCDENIRKYSQLLLATDEKKGVLITVSCCSRAGPRIEIDGYCILNAGLDVGDHLIVQYGYGLIRVRKMPGRTNYVEPIADKPDFKELDF